MPFGTRFAGCSCYHAPTRVSCSSALCLTSLSLPPHVLPWMLAWDCPHRSSRSLVAHHSSLFAWNTSHALLGSLQVLPTPRITTTLRWSATGSGFAPQFTHDIIPHGLRFAARCRSFLLPLPRLWDLTSGPDSSWFSRFLPAHAWDTLAHSYYLRARTVCGSWTRFTRSVNWTIAFLLYIPPRRNARLRPLAYRWNTFSFLRGFYATSLWVCTATTAHLFAWTPRTTTRGSGSFRNTARNTISHTRTASFAWTHTLGFGCARLAPPWTFGSRARHHAKLRTITLRLLRWLRSLPRTSRLAPRDLSPSCWDKHSSAASTAFMGSALALSPFTHTPAVRRTVLGFAVYLAPQTARRPYAHRFAGSRRMDTHCASPRHVYLPACTVRHSHTCVWIFLAGLRTFCLHAGLRAITDFLSPLLSILLRAFAGHRLSFAQRAHRAAAALGHIPFCAVLHARAPVLHFVYTSLRRTSRTAASGFQCACCRFFALLPYGFISAFARRSLGVPRACTHHSLVAS